MFSVTQIPRTILFNQKNELENFYGANPSSGAQLEHQIDGILNKNSTKYSPPLPPGVPDKLPSQKVNYTP
jgi:thioredoxin-like negative regulator of GroEL